MTEMSSSVRRVYKALIGDSGLTIRGMGSKLQLNARTVSEAVGTLVKYGYIRRVGPKKGGHWEIVKR